LRHTAGAALVVVLVLLAAACGSSSKSGSPSNATSTTAAGGSTPTTWTTASLLGAEQRATGTPVKVGLITNGGACEGCGNGDDEPVSRATIQWLNEHRNGLAGHPIALDVCVDGNDPGKTADCANQMIRDNVAAVVIGTSGVIDTTWKILHDAKMPVINVSTTNTGMLADAASTYILNDPGANTVGFPIGVAKNVGTTKLSIIVIDVPAATDIYKTSMSAFQNAGIDAKVIPVAMGTADMTPQAQQIVSSNPDGLVMIVGHDQFCIPAIQGLHAVGFTGTIATISQCITPAMRKAIPSDEVKGIRISSVAPVGDSSSELMAQYQAVLDTYAKGKKIDPTNTVGIGTYQSWGALNSGTEGLTGAVTPASVNQAMHAMKDSALLASGLHLRCNGKAVPALPADCSAGVLAATLDAKGNAVKYDVVNDRPIPD
jgi:branched-chain amino acid transport system substrate-binding protein